MGMILVQTDVGQVETELENNLNIGTYFFTFLL